MTTRRADSAGTDTRLDVETLLAFFAAESRDLPWREPSAGPWGVMVSEFMLQQTPVPRVLPIYLQWLARWPAPADLAAEPSGEAVRAWGRLGYPRRAQRLHAAAQVIVADHGGRVPCSIPELLALPGVGDYTARAIAAFAFGARTPVVDTNVRRVLSRVVRGADSVREPATTADREQLASLLPDDPRTAARFSAAVMEFGALRCTAGNPRCTDCPLAARCAWLQAGRPAAVPRRAAQSWHGTDRQVRGRILALLREHSDPLPRSTFDAVWPDAGQLGRCLESLLADGLAVVEPGDLIGLAR